MQSQAIFPRPVARTRKSIPLLPRTLRFKVNGQPLVLAGRFSNWLPVALIGQQAGQPDPSVVQLLVDVTSAEPAPARARDLLSFEGTKVRKVGDNSFAVQGQIKVGRERRPVEILVQSPEAHSPFVFLTVPIDREKDSVLWGELNRRLGSAAGANDTGLELRPAGWLRPPVPAAA